MLQQIPAVRPGMPSAATGNPLREPMRCPAGSYPIYGVILRASARAAIVLPMTGQAPVPGHPLACLEVLIVPGRHIQRIKAPAFEAVEPHVAAGNHYGGNITNWQENHSVKQIGHGYYSKS